MEQNNLLESLNTMSQRTLVANLGIEFTEVGPDFVSAKMPVDERTVQPFGLLHGGASVALAETLGSIASALQVDINKKICVGLDINANHLRSARSGYVHGTARAIHLGQRTHVWEIKIVDDADRMISICRLTVMVLDRDELSAKE
jgi:1,4-dihydroxy-2-naphthoyl-CoA hydrolase